MKKVTKLSIILLAITILCSGGTIGEAPGQANNELIRLHVLANSDSQKDQYLKYKVRDAIIENIGYKFSTSENINETRKLLKNNLSLVEEVAQKTLKNLGSGYKVKAQYGNFYFPTKYYGNFSLPAGEYEAVRVIIGKGQGANWWCVLFPPLCFVNTDNQVDNINSPTKLNNKEIKIGFKFIEWLKEYFPTIGRLFK